MWKDAKGWIIGRVLGGVCGVYEIPKKNRENMDFRYLNL